jgi:hypothetical protein
MCNLKTVLQNLETVSQILIQYCIISRQFCRILRQNCKSRHGFSISQESIQCTSAVQFTAILLLAPQQQKCPKMQKLWQKMKKTITWLLFPKEVFEASESDGTSRMESINVVNLCSLSFLPHRTCNNSDNSVCVHRELRPFGQSPKYRTAKPNSDRGESVKVSVISLDYRRGWSSESTLDMEMRWTNSHQHQPSYSSSSTSTFSNTNARE